MRFTLAPLLLAAAVSAAPMQDLEKRAACSSYTIINTRGTSEVQGPSVGFLTMNANVLASLPGGKTYDTVYPAAWDQNSTAATIDIVYQIQTGLQANPDECFVLEGYSQGAAATVNAMPKLNGTDFDAVVGVFLIGDPMHTAGLDCNVDNEGGSTTKDVDGLSVALGSIPSGWINKTLDVCILVSSRRDLSYSTS